MPTARENATASLENCLARLAELDAVPITVRTRMTYTDAGQTYGWNEYRSALMDQVKGFTDLLKALQASDGPFEVRSGGGYYGPWGV